MSERILLWALGKSDKGREVAAELEELATAETEQRLEELLVTSPDVLIPGLRLIGRQLQTSGGPLDLLGIDPEGRIILFELKRGTLTREAVAQILDYGSDLLEHEPEDFAKLIENGSGRLGIDQIENFSEWFSTEFPEVSEPALDDLRMVLVGLGLDERAKRIVNLLARSGIDIQLLTFQAFRREDEVFLARQSETVEPRVRGLSSGGGGKEDNRRALEALAREHAVLDLFIEIADFVAERMPAYRWPNKTNFVYSLTEETEAGRPTQRSYAALWVDQKSQGRVTFSLPERAIEVASEVVNDAVMALPAARMTSSGGWTPFEMGITQDSWAEDKLELEKLLTAVVSGWQATRDGDAN